MAATHYQIFCRYYHSFVNRAVINDLNDKANLCEWVSGENKSLSKLASDYKETPIQQNIPVIKLVMSDGSIKWYTLKDLTKVKNVSDVCNYITSAYKDTGYVIGDYEDLREIIFDEATGKTIEDTGDTRVTMYPTPSITVQNGDSISPSVLGSEYDSAEIEKNRLTTENAVLQAEIDSLTISKTSKQSIVDTKQSTLTAKQAAVATAQANVTAAEEAYNTAIEEEKDAKLALLNSANEALAAATEEFETANTEYQTALEELNAVSSELAQKQTQKAENDASIASLTTTMSGIAARIEKVNGTWQFKAGAAKSYIGQTLSTGVIASIYKFKMISENISVFASKNMTNWSYFYNLNVEEKRANDAALEKAKKSLAAVDPDAKDAAEQKARIQAKIEEYTALQEEYENSEYYEKLFFTLNDYTSKKEAIENIWIRFEDCLLASEKDSVKASRKQLQNIKNARKLDTTLGEISTRENVSTNPKFDMIFLYDGLATETAGLIRNVQGKSYTTWARRWHDAKEDIRVIPKKVRDTIRNAWGEEPENKTEDDGITDPTNTKIPKTSIWTSSLGDLEEMTYDTELVGCKQSALAINGVYSNIENPFALPFTTDAKIILKKSDVEPAFTFTEVQPIFVKKNPKAANSKYVIVFLHKEELEELWNGKTVTFPVYMPSTAVEGTEEEDDDGSSSTSFDDNPNTLYVKSKETKSYNFQQLFMPEESDELYYFEDGQSEVEEDFELEEAQNITPYVYYEKFKRFELSPWFVYANCGSLKYALTKAEELVGIMGLDNVMIGKVVDLTQYIEIA